MLIGSISMIGLLPVYQRNYNIAAVLFVMVWAFENLNLPVARIVLLLSAFFLVPGEALLRRFGTGHSSEHDLAWNVVVMSQRPGRSSAWYAFFCTRNSGTKEIGWPCRKGPCWKELIHSRL